MCANMCRLLSNRSSGARDGDRDRCGDRDFDRSREREPFSSMNWLSLGIVVCDETTEVTPLTDDRGCTLGLLDLRRGGGGGATLDTE